MLIVLILKDSMVILVVLGCTPNYGTVNSHVMMTNALNQVGGLV